MRRFHAEGPLRQHRPAGPALQACAPFMKQHLLGALAAHQAKHSKSYHKERTMKQPRKGRRPQPLVKFRRSLTTLRRWQLQAWL